MNLRPKQMVLAACLKLQVDSFALRTRVSASPVKQGFTLAELLIALALLGIIAAFTIPKVLQSSAEQETNAKLRETVATLENAWYTMRATNNITYNAFIMDALLPSINAVQSGSTPIFTSPTPGTVPPLTLPIGVHPCEDDPTDGGFSAGAWFQLANGVVVAGYTGGGLRSLHPYPNEMAGYATPIGTTPICIDVNGVAGPNLPGQDVFFGGFNQYNAFTGLPTNENERLKSFSWGSPSTPLVISDGGPPITYNLTTHGAVGDGTRTPCALVGCRLTQ